jgi:flagellar biosynthesis protein
MTTRHHADPRTLLDARSRLLAAAGSGGRGLRIEAAAVGYRRGIDPAPRVVAKGTGAAAERILERADRDGVPVHRDPDLLQSLSVLRVGDEIPHEAFTAVAEILAFLYERNGSLGTERGAGARDPRRS